MLAAKPAPSTATAATEARQSQSATVGAAVDFGATAAARRQITATGLLAAVGRATGTANAAAVATITGSAVAAAATATAME